MSISRNMFLASAPILSAAAFLSAGAAYAQNEAAASSSSPPEARLAAPAAATQYWTVERLQGATPLLPSPGNTGPDGLPTGSQIVSPQLVAPQLAAPQAAGQNQKGEGGLPSITLEPAVEKQLVPKQEGMLMEEESIVPEMTSSFGARFTTSRVFPADAVTTYPYRAAGKLFFSDPKGATSSAPLPFLDRASLSQPDIA